MNLYFSCKQDQTLWEIFSGVSWGSWVSPAPALAQDTPLDRNEVGGLPGAWARLVAALLLLAVGFSLAVRQLHTQGGSTETLGSVAPPPSGHAHHPGVYHHGAIISPAGQCWEQLRGGEEPGSLVPGPSP